MPNAEANPAAVDLRARIASASRRVDLEAIMKAGGKSAFVLPVGRIEALVREAVDRALAARKVESTPGEAERIEADAKRRLEDLLVRQREVLRLKAQAEEALLDLARRMEATGPGAPIPDLAALARQVAAMAALLRGETPAATAAGEPIRALLAGLGAGSAGDDRLDRILLQLERLAAAVEGTERRMRGLAPAASVEPGPNAEAASPPLELFRAILEENLKLTRGDAAEGT
ncbi:MAG TPA: hypothetical protein VFI25_12025 [Planctomycetota bacterium]|jgi:hypothetical protein|nr:hypothetical protein [Planctomycetota bacterium]